MKHNLKVGDLIKFNTRSYGWVGVVAMITGIAKSDDGKVLVNYHLHNYHGTTTLDRIIPVCNHDEDDNA